MKGREFAKLILNEYPEHEIVIQEYTGCNHTIFTAKELIPADRGEKLKTWDGSGDENFDLKTGKAKKKILLIR